MYLCTCPWWEATVRQGRSTRCGQGQEHEPVLLCLLRCVGAGTCNTCGTGRLPCGRLLPEKSGPNSKTHQVAMPAVEGSFESSPELAGAGFEIRLP